LGFYHGGNQGDECVVTALIQNIRRRCPDAEIVGFSLNPEDTRRRHGIAAYPIRVSAETPAGSGPETAVSEPRTHGGHLRAFVRCVPPLRAFGWWLGGRFETVRAIAREPAFLWRSYRRLQGTDLVILAGSGPLEDGGGGPWNHPYAVFKWALLCRLRGTHFVPLNVGGGPIRHRLTRIFLRQAIRWSAYRSFRDRHTADLIAALGVPGENPVLPDLAFSLDLPKAPAPAEIPGLQRGKGVVALTPLPHHDGRYANAGDRQSYERYLSKLVGFAAWLLRNGYSVALVATQLVADPLVCADLEQALQAIPDLQMDKRLAHPFIEAFEDLIRVYSACDYVVAARFHGIILPMLLGKPVVAMAYHPKTPALMSYMGQDEFCLDIDNFTTDHVSDCFTRLVEHRDEALQEARSRIPTLRRMLEAQYDRLLGFLA
jgi:polysaccharide pyruvyl transferase WcaK-like protein